MPGPGGGVGAVPGLGSAWSGRGVLLPGEGAWSGGVCSQGEGGLVWGEGGLLPGGACSRGDACSRGGACSGGVPGVGPRDGYCCGRYASYWNAFVFYLHERGNKVARLLKSKCYRQLMFTFVPVDPSS